MSAALGDLENYRIQLQQVEAALVAEPESEELLKLKSDLIEIIQLQEELVAKEELPVVSGTSGGSGLSGLSERITWKVGDRCLAPSKNGKKQLASIDGISQDKVAITFCGNGAKHMVRLSELSKAPTEEKKNYLFTSNNSSKGGPKKEWQMERERRKLRAQKKEQRRKTLEETKEQEKNKWKSFNAKAMSKNMKGLKRIEASAIAADHPRGSGSNRTLISSRKDVQVFGSNQRSREIMDSLF